MNFKTNERLGAVFLSVLMLISNVSPTYAYAKAIISGNQITLTQSSQQKGGALPVSQVDPGTGNVTLHESLLSVEGYTAKIAYNSEGVAQKAITWNRSQKQGTMGLGWEYPENRIIRLTKQTGTLEDDSFMLYMEGSTYPLLYISTEDGEKEYRFAKQHDWIVKHHIEQDQWRLYMPDGQIYIFGEGSLTTHQGDSEEYNVKWGNWIGSSIDTLNQSRFPISYNMSAIEDIYGEQIKFFYETDEEQVGEGKNHTKAAYLKQVNGLRGKILEFTYSIKDISEFNDPHTENGVDQDSLNDQDAYQERYEASYLTGIELKNRNEELIKKVSFEYENLNKHTELDKRLLTGINYLDSEGDPYMPPKTFDYFGLDDSDGVFAGLTAGDTKMYNPDNGALYAAIKQENLPEGVSYGYHYGKQEINGSSKTLQIDFPPAPYNEEYDVTAQWSAPELFYGSDYVVAIFESQDLTLRQSYVKAYHWIGDRWFEKDLGSFDGYFYDRYLAKDEYNKGVLKKLKEGIFDQLEVGAPIAAGAFTALNDAFTDLGKTFYKVGDDLHNGQVGKAIEDWFIGGANIFKDVVLDVAASLEKEADLIKTFFDTVFVNKHGLFNDHQKQLYEARADDEVDHPRKTYHITLQEDFFAMTSSWGGSQVVIVQKNTLSPGEWFVNRENANIYSKFFTFDSGDNFVVLLDEVTDFMYIYSWDGLIWSTQLTKLNNDFNPIATATQGKNDFEIGLDSLLGENAETPEERLDHRSAVAAQNNMILAVITDSHGINADITLFHHDENMNWSYTGANANKKAVIGAAIEAGSGQSFSLANSDQFERFSGVFGKDAKIDVKLGNSFAVLQTYDNLDENLPDVSDIPLVGNLISGFVPDFKKTNSTFGIVWDENFENIKLTHLHSAVGQTGIESFVVGDVINKIGSAHSLLVGSNNKLAPDDGKNYAFRYTGNNFVAQQFESPYYTSGFANDVTSTLIESADKAYKTPQFYQFDPNTNTWGQISNASQEQISAPDFVDEAINVSVEVINIIVQIVTAVIPGAGEALELAESTLSTLKTVESIANVAGLVTMVAGPIAKELTKDIMGTNHKSTSIANNYISVNGKLFHRQPSGEWVEITDDEFGLSQDVTLVGGTNNVVNSFIPYTLNNNGNLENHLRLLRNGQIYDSKQSSATDYVVHQDSISATIGAGAYVSYGPVNPENGFVQENEYVKQFEPVIASSAEARSRKNRPAYKDATQVQLHKIIGTTFEDELYDYPVTKVTIKEGDNDLSYRYYQYDGQSAAHDSHSQVTFYGKVTDIPSSKEHTLNEAIDLATTDGGYIEHYYYNRYNTYHSDSTGTGYLSGLAQLKVADSTNFVVYDSGYDDDQTSFKNGNVNVLYGHPYATLMYNTSQDVVSSDHTYYKVWEQDLRHQLNGEFLQETKTYDVRTVKKIQTTDGVAHQTRYEYGYNPLSLVLRKTITDGVTPDGSPEHHTTSYVYASEHYDDLRLANRVKEHFMTLQSVQQGTDPEKVINADVTAYETFKVNGKNVWAPKHFYKAVNPKSPDSLLVSASDITDPIPHCRPR
ncbi:hypothetical protein AB832_06440 [Flavobacteriaceae bacterium (ex Bugula neritina AB1)]|nr:hypothetical protein AB832_06440 [Flavobacteriaceae bacterium (ex Bugula neritina AB1)]